MSSSTIELVHDVNQSDGDVGSGLSHFVIQVESIDSTIADLAARGIEADVATSPDGSTDFLTSSIVDPDGNTIELVQWSAGHTDGMSAADWPD